MRPRIGTSIRELPLLWKLLLPFLILVVLLGAFGAFLIVRDLSSRAETALQEDLLSQSLEARSLIHDRELFLLESANFAANLEGMAESIKAGNKGEAARLLQSVLALKTDLTLVAVTDRSGTGLAEFSRDEPNAQPSLTEGTPWGDRQVVLPALAGEKSSGFLKMGERRLLTISTPVCSAATECAPVGAAIVGIDVGLLASEAEGTSARGTRKDSVAIYDMEGQPLVSNDRPSPAAPPTDSETTLVRRIERIGSTDFATLFAPLDVQGRRVGTLAVTTPTEPAFASVRGAGVRLALIFLATMAGVMAIGALLTRFILDQVNPLIRTNEALGLGDLSARAPVRSGDELGRLAKGVNQMAEQLEASYETLESRVAQRTEEVQRLLRERTDFFTAISHEFRTPLAVILRQAELLLDPSYRRVGRWGANSGQLIKGSASQLLSLINEILLLAEAESGRIEIHPEDFSLQELAKELRPTIKGLSDPAGLALTLRIPKELPLVRADRGRVREIFLNLVDNAVKYTPSGGKVEVSARESDGRVEVSVSDTGVGIPEEARQRIFEPFYRVEGTAPGKGRYSTGLGLSLTKRLVEAQRGEIWFDDRRGGGTTFTFTLVPGDPRRAHPSVRGRFRQTASK